MRVLVCGGRDYDDWETVCRVLDAIALGAGPMTIVHGACGENADKPSSVPIYRGADGLAHAWAVTRGQPVEPVPAHWTTGGKAAGPRRNQRMLDEKRPSLVVAFPGDRGTADMVRRAQSAGVPVVDRREVA